MAAAIAPRSFDQHHHAPPAPSMSAPHGTKRPADGSLDGEQRLSKRFDLLNLDNTNKPARLYLPVPSTTHAAAAPTVTTPHPLAPNASPAAPAAPAAPASPPKRPPPADTDAMLVEDTPHRVYIHDLAAELSDTDSDSEHPIFLSDVEKHLSRIPRHVLLGPPAKPTQHNQMVLYNVPASLTVPAERDNVRKAIVEARQRIREGQLSAVTEPGRVYDDADAMDLD